MHYHVLLIDPDADNCDLFQAVLGTKSTQSLLRCVESGQEALDVLSQIQFDVILCEENLPDCHGYVFLQEWRQREIAQGLVMTPAITFTDTDNLVTLQQALAAGFQVCIPKPVDLYALLLVVKALVDRI